MAYSPPGEFSRVCDVCGCKKPSSRVRKVGASTWVCDEHPGYVPADLANKRARPIITKIDIRAKDARAMQVRETLESVEADVFRFVVSRAPIDFHDWTNGSGVGGAESIQAAAWGALYLADLITEDKRPLNWIATAKTKLTELATWMVGAMAGDSSWDILWGGFLREGAYHAEDAGAAGLALLRAWQVLDDETFLAYSQRCAWFLRSCQCGDKLVTGAAPSHSGAWSHSATAEGLDLKYYPGDLIGLEFLIALYGAIGNVTIGSDVCDETPFASSRACTLTTAITEAATFWASAAGFTVTMPAEYFDVAEGAWKYADGEGTITSRNWALGIRGIAAASGLDAALPRFEWLSAFTSNPAFEPAGVDEGRMIMGEPLAAIWPTTKGTYDAKGAPAVTLLVKSEGSAVAINGDGLYDMAALGHLAACYSVRRPVDFEETRTTFGRPQPKFMDGGARDGERIVPLLLGRCGLSLQPYSDAGASQRIGSVARAAQAGRVFRFPPQIFQERGR